MLDYLWLINVHLLLDLNHLVASNARLYTLSLFVTDKFSDLLTVATFGLLWFWPQTREVPLFLHYGSGASGGWLFRLMAGLRATYLRWATSLSRVESRAQFIVMAFAGVSGYITARLLALQFNIQRPFDTYLPVRAPIEGAFTDLRTYGSFPSDHAVMLALLPVALLYWDRRLAGIWLVLALLLAATRVAVGFHYPVDILGGAVIGVLYAGVLLSLYRRKGKLHEAANLLARSFDLSNSPYCYLLYFLALLCGLEFAMHFQHVLDTIFALRGDLQGRFGR
jgi:membrane-associated phospholipid phosphatase